MVYKKTSESKAGDSPAIEGLHEALILSGIASMPSVVKRAARCRTGIKFQQALPILVD